MHNNDTKSDVYEKYQPKEGDIEKTKEGQKTGPCGTPHVHAAEEEVMLSIYTNQFKGYKPV